MFARIVTYKIKPGTADQMQYLVEQTVVPFLQIRTGFRELALVQVNDTEVIAFEAWDTQETAEASKTEVDQKIQQTIGHVFSAPPSFAEGRVIVHEGGPGPYEPGIRILR